MTDKLIMTTAQRDLAISAARIGQQLNDDRDNELHQDELSVLRDAIAMLQFLPIFSAEPAAYRLPDPDVPKKYHYFDLDEVEPVKHALEALYTSPQAITPITDDDVTDEILEAYLNDIHSFKDHKAVIANIYNAVIKHRSE